MTKPLQLAGQVFGSLTVLRRVATKPRSVWECVCVCGVVKTYVGSELTLGRVRSCGCMRGELIAKAKTTHGRSRSRAYRMWAAMLHRCGDSNNARYGGRGIVVDERWRVFSEFYADMGDPPPKHSLGRIDNEQGYCAQNCRWETVAQQNRNRSVSRLVEFGGVIDTVAAHARRAGLHYDTVYHRIFRQGWAVSEALTTVPFGTRVEVPL